MTEHLGTQGSVTLHIGLEKTGTSSLQLFLADNAALLRQDGTIVSNLPRRSGVSLIAGCLADPERQEDIHKFFKISPTNQMAARALVQRHLASELSAGLTVLVSSEHLSSRVVSPREIQMLADLLEPIASELRVVLYLRRQEVLIPSTYSTSVLAGGVHAFSLGAALKERHRYDYAALLDRWCLVFPERLSVHVFREEWKDGTGELHRHFCRSAGILWNQDFVVRAERIHRSLSQQALQICVWLNRMATEHRLATPIWREFMLRAFELDRQRPFSLEEDERARVSEHFRATNEQAARALSPEDAQYLLQPTTPRDRSAPPASPNCDASQLIAEVLARAPQLDRDSAPFYEK